ncbi:uncharacterized protein LOC117603910 isoform X4 [Osmia lignaria lignaria]|uniref:uncharacterized protein LOC114879033 isoform X5 n=1 Tax=Osmia bicornis bicornis TaxID=1437191 RepID=UPI0010F60FE7|nr:uncharacterized protein LOC114879033 isoform X5 [Osmia bicornis bicornis]XP_034179396.1 uncharacterized protein LOC117603910 isoform X6 [Osmia lignaria]
MRALPSALRLTCCRSWLLLLIYLVFLVSGCSCDTRPDRLTHQLLPGDDVHGSSYINDEDDLYDDEEDYLEENVTAAKGQYLGSPCDVSCNPELQHVFCDTVTGHCECEKFYPVRLGPSKGCAKPKKLGEQCFYRATCTFADQHSTCTQVQHNAVCDCEEGYHRVALSRPNKKVFCAEDLVLITTDIPTLLCIASGIAIFTAMICFVLKLFSRARYSRPRHYANANHAPPMLFSSDTGSRRPSLTSVHSSTSSARSYSARRLEKERNEKEQRQALQELRLAKQREQQQQQQQQVAPTPSPRTPHSTDELLPSVEEGKEVFYNEQVPTTSDTTEETTAKTTAITATNVNRFGEKSPVTTSTTSIFETNIAPRATGDIFQV